MKLEDGTGKGNLAKVDEDNRIHTNALNVPLIGNISKDTGRAFIFRTDFIALTTTGSPSGVLYIKNDSSENLHINSIRTCGDMAWHKATVRKNPTLGTLISGGTNSQAIGLNFSSAASYDGEVKIGTDSDTVTDGTLLTQWQSGVGTHTENFDGSLILGKEKTLAILIEPSAAGDVCVGVFGFYNG